MRATSQTDVEYLMVLPGPWETFVNDGPLHRRAWVVQERLLAPRVLHFCYNMVFWECPCLLASEVEPLGEMYHDDYSLRNIKATFASAFADPDDFSSRDGPWVFNDIVRDCYSRAELTYPRDRLPAISGIARRCMPRHGHSAESYMAGLWRENLPRCLLWHFDSPPQDGAVRDLEAAPSWSWASVISNTPRLNLDGYRMFSSRPLFQDFRTIIIPKNGDRFAQLDVATLRLPVTVIPVDRERINGAPHMRLSRDSTWYKESYDFRSGRTTTTLCHKLSESMPRLGYRLGLISKRKLQENEKTANPSYVQIRWVTADMMQSDEASFRPRQLYMVPMLWDRGWGNRSLSPWKLDLRGLILQRLRGKGQYGTSGGLGCS